MLRSLRIENLVLIKEADVQFGSGLNALTGETGSGKSIAAQSFGLLLGEKAAKEMVGPHGQDAYVEAEFDVPEGLLDEEEFESLRELGPDDEPGIILARRVFADGRSRAYAWGRSIAREDLVAIGDRLLSMSGQFEQRRLSKPSYQMDLLDAYAGEQQLRRRDETAKAWRTLVEAQRARDAIAQDRGAAAARLEEMRLLVEATDDFGEGEEDELLLERQRLLRVNDLAVAAQASAEALSPEIADSDGSADLAGQAARALNGLRAVDPELKEIGEQIDGAEDLLRDAASRLRGYLEALEGDPRRLEVVETRLQRMTDARRRFASSFQVQSYADLLERREEARDALAEREAGIDPLQAAEGDVAKAEAAYGELAAQLRKAREKAAKGFAKAVKEELAALGLGDGELRVAVTDKAPGPRGRDEVTFEIKPNAGLPFGSIQKIASGGELSRIALALRVVSHGQSGEGTVIFDEIDAGVGGVTAHSVADSLRRLGETSQVLVITHLPQVASAAQTHLVVTKAPGDPTQTEIAVLAEEGRPAELERMLGGAEFLSALGTETQEVLARES